MKVGGVLCDGRPRDDDEDDGVCRKEITGNTRNPSRLLRHPTSFCFFRFYSREWAGERACERNDENFGSIMPGYACHLIAMHFRPR